MMIRLKPSVEILEEIPHILLVPTRYTDQFKLSLGDLKAYLQEQFKLANIGSQCPEVFEIEECDYVVALKKSQKDNYFCALKILFKSYHDVDTQLKINVLYSLKERYMLEMYDGNNYQHLDYTQDNLSAHVTEVQKNKKRHFHESLSAFYINN
jgi:hypothetical protein